MTRKPDQEYQREIPNIRDRIHGFQRLFHERIEIRVRSFAVQHFVEDLLHEQSECGADWIEGHCQERPFHTKLPHHDQVAFGMFVGNEFHPA